MLLSPATIAAMKNTLHKSTLLAVGILLGALLGGCTPTHDWREIRQERPSFSVLMPAKPSSQTREIKLGEAKVSMTMTAVEVDHATYAVGSVELADSKAAKDAMLQMKTALVGRLDNKIRKEDIVDNPTESRIDVEAVGTPKGESRIVIARFIAQEKYAYQIVLTGPEKTVTRDQIDTFMTSFKTK